MDLGFVQEAITQEQLSRDLEATLARYFPKNIEGRHIAARILELLGRKQDMNQKTIAEELGIPEYALSRIISSLEAGRLVTRKKVGLDKLVRLTESD